MVRAMKDSGVEWLGNIPETWKMVRVKNIFSNHKKIVGDKEAEYERLSLTLNGVLKRPKDDSKGLQSESLSTYQILCEKELVFKMIDLENVNTSRVGYSPYTGIVSPVYIILNNEKYTKYGYYYFYNMWQRAIFNQLGNNGVRSALNASDMLNLPFPNISQEDAEKIAKFLDEKIGEIDAIIDKIKMSIEEYKKYKVGVITEAVLGTDREEDKYKNVDNIFIKRIPIEWELCKLKYLSEEIGDGLHSTPEYDDEGDVYFINGNNIGGEYLEIKSSTNRLNDLEYSKYKKPLLNGQTIMIALNGATYGKLSFYNFEKVLLGKSAGYITLKNGINKGYMKYYLQSSLAKNFMSLSLNGTTIQNLSLGTLNEMLIIVPTEAEQQIIVEFLDSRCMEIDALIKKKETFIDEMETYKKSLIFEYVTGKKEVV